METEGPGFAIIDEDGVAFYIAKTYDEALAVAARAMPHADVWYEGPPPWEEEEGPRSTLAVAANVGTLHRIGKKGGEPERALGLLDLEPMTTRQILDVDLEDAFAELRPFFPTRGDSGSQAATYDTAESMVENFFGANYKVSKPTSRGIQKSMATGLNMMPAKSWENPRAQETIRQARSYFGVADVRPPKGITVCASATIQCSQSCLVFSGRNTRDYATIKKLALTMSLIHKPLAFMRVLYAAAAAWEKSCECNSATPYLRLNVYSDVPWELLIPDMFAHFRKIRFYDYTKVSGRMAMINGRYPIENYDLTFSYSGSKPNLLALNSEIEKNKRRVAVTFAGIGVSKYVAPGGEAIPTELPKPGGKGTEHLWPQSPEIGLPKTFMGLPVVDGDRNDFRPLDPHPCVVGLRWKTPKLQHVTAKKARVFIVPGYLVNERGEEDERGKTFVIMDLPRYKDVFGSEMKSLPWKDLDFSHVTIEEAD